MEALNKYSGLNEDSSPTQNFDKEPLGDSLNALVFEMNAFLSNNSIGNGLAASICMTYATSKDGITV